MPQDRHAQTAAKREKCGFAKAVWVQRRTLQKCGQAGCEPAFPSSLGNAAVVLLHPMLATWNTASAAITFAKSTRREPPSVFCVLLVVRGIAAIDF
jgi:uracil phosphoribosyltransferase